MDSPSKPRLCGFQSVKMQGDTSVVDLPLFRYELFQRDIQKLLNIFICDYRSGFEGLDQVHRVEFFLGLMCKRKLYEDIVSYITRNREGIMGMVVRFAAYMVSVEDVGPIVCGLYQQTPGCDCDMEKIRTTTSRCAILIQLCGMMKMLLPELYDRIEPLLKGSCSRSVEDVDSKQ